MAEKRKRTWLKRAAIGLAVTVAAALISPFIFTTTMVRWYLGRGPMASLHVELSKATLSPRGELYLYNLRVHDPSQPETLPLVKAEAVQIGFLWRRIFSGQVESIDVYGLSLIATPRLANLVAKAEEDLGNKGSAAPSSSSPPPSIKRIAINGVVHLEELSDYASLSVSELPLQVLLTADEGNVPVYDISAVAGNADVLTVTDGPALAVRGQARFLGTEGWRINVESATLKNAVLNIPPEHIEALPASLGDNSGGAQLAVGGLNASGIISFDGSPRFIGEVTLQRGDMRFKTASTDMIERLRFSAACDVALSADLFTKSTVNNASLSVRSVRAGDLEVAALTAKPELRDGEFRLRECHGTVAEGTFDLTLTMNPDNGVREAYLRFDKINQAIIARNVATDRLGAQGLISGTAVLSRDAFGRLTGSLEVESAGPGRLAIKDKAFTDALAAKAPVPTGATVPPNMQDIIVEQLRDYPYTAGFVQASDKPGGVELVLDYTRRPLELGDPGYGVMIELDGQTVRANYPVHLRSFTLVLPGRTVADLLELGSGLKSRVATAVTQPATRPAP